MSDTTSITETEQVAPKINLIDRGRSRVMHLQYPAEVDGVLLDKIVVRRMSTSQVAEFVERLQAAKGDIAMVRFPMFFDEAGKQIPDAVFDALDDDDTLRLTEIAADFLPQRFRASPEPDTPQSIGEHIALS